MDAEPAFAQVIPLLKTPTGVDAFDYRLPTTDSLHVGDLVLIPFRRQRIVGLIRDIQPTSLFAEKAATILHRYGTISLPPAFLDLLRWTSERTFCSQPTILHAWLRALPKRPSLEHALPIFPTRGAKQIETHWLAEPESALIARANELHRAGKRILLLTPWKTRAERLHQALPESTLLTSEQSMGEYTRTWQRFCTTENNLLISTRIGAWLMPFADHLLLDEPENDDHKQDELSPRYDVRKCAAWMATVHHLPLETFGITPALHVTASAPTISVQIQTFVRHPDGRTDIPTIQADALFALESHQGPCVIIHPIRGLLAHLTCRDCGWQPTCPTCEYPVALDTQGTLCRLCKKTVSTPLECPTCGNVDLGKSFPGIERLKKAWEDQYPDQPIEWRDLSNEQMDAPFKPGAFVLVTLPSLLGGAVEDIRRHERQCVALRRLASRVASAKGILGLQGEESELTRWLSWLTSEGVEALFEEERAARRLFQYPPSVRRVKLLVDKEPSVAERWQAGAAKILPSTLRWEGPFSAAYGTPGQRRRSIWHLLVPADIPETALSSLLLPLAKDAKIDLDPIAFFK